MSHCRHLLLWVLFVGFTGTGLAAPLPEPRPEEVWDLVRQVAAIAYELDGLDYEVPTKSKEIEALIAARSGGLVAPPEITFSRKDGVNRFLVQFPTMPEIFRLKAEAKVQDMLRKISICNLLRELGWTAIASSLRTLDGVRQYDLISWTDDEATVEFNGMAEPFAGSVLRSFRLKVDRRRQLVREMTLWLGGNKTLRGSIKYESERFFPGTRMPLVTEMSLVQQGGEGPREVTMQAGANATYTRSVAALRDAATTTLRTQFLKAGFQRSHLDNIKADADGMVSLYLSGKGLATLPALRGLPIRELKLNSLNLPNLEGLAGAPIERLHIENCSIQDFSALRGLPLKVLNMEGIAAFRDCNLLTGMKLEELNLKGTAVADLAPLRGMPLKQLWISGTAVSSLEPVRGAPLEMLELWGSLVSDLSPLAGMESLRKLSCSATPIADFSPVRTLRKLETLHLSGQGKTDLAPLAGLPLKQVRLAGSNALDLRPLLQCPTLEQLTIPNGTVEVDLLRELPRLQRLSRVFVMESGEPAETVAEFWGTDQKGPVDTIKNLVTQLNAAGLKSKIERADDGTLRVDLSGQTVTDLSLLQGFPISWLNLNNTNISSIAAVRELPLRALQLNYCKVRDLSPIEGMKLHTLELDSNPVESLEPIRKLPLKKLNLVRIKLPSLEMVTGMPLENLSIAGCGVTTLEPLRGKRMFSLNMAYTADCDLSALPSVGIQDLRLHGCKLKPGDIAILQACTNLKLLQLPSGLPDYSFLHSIPTLRQVGIGDDALVKLYPINEIWAQIPRRAGGTKED